LEFVVFHPEAGKTVKEVIVTDEKTVMDLAVKPK